MGEPAKQASASIGHASLWLVNTVKTSMNCSFQAVVIVPWFTLSLCHHITLRPYIYLGSKRSRGNVTVSGIIFCSWQYVVNHSNSILCTVWWSICVNLQFTPHKTVCCHIYVCMCVSGWCVTRRIQLSWHLLCNCILSTWTVVLSCHEAACLPQLWSRLWLNVQNCIS